MYFPCKNLVETTVLGESAAEGGAKLGGRVDRRALRER
jgi:hypothetical protein